MLVGESLNGFEGKTVSAKYPDEKWEPRPAGLAVVACGADPTLILYEHAALRTTWFRR